MKKLILLVFVMLTTQMSAQRIKSFVERQMRDYPKSRLLDIYKSCFQDYMGAEHLVTDSEGVRAYLMQELSTTRLDDLMPWYDEPCGIKGRYVRVSLRAVMENKITADALLNAFVRSANAIKRPSVRKWKRQWHKILNRIERMNLQLPNYEEDKQLLDSVLQAGKYAVSHSESYRQAYHPHYRIIERRIFEKEIKQALPPTMD